MTASFLARGSSPGSSELRGTLLRFFFRCSCSTHDLAHVTRAPPQLVFIFLGQRGPSISSPYLCALGTPCKVHQRLSQEWFLKAGKADGYTTAVLRIQNQRPTKLHPKTFHASPRRPVLTLSGSIWAPPTPAPLLVRGSVGFAWVRDQLLLGTSKGLVGLWVVGATRNPEEEQLQSIVLFIGSILRPVAFQEYMGMGAPIKGVELPCSPTLASLLCSLT